MTALVGRTVLDKPETVELLQRPPDWKLFARQVGSIALACERGVWTDVVNGWHLFLNAARRWDLFEFPAQFGGVPERPSVAGFALLRDRVLSVARNLDALDAERHWREAAASFAQAKVNVGLAVIAEARLQKRADWDAFWVAHPPVHGWLAMGGLRLPLDEDEDGVIVVPPPDAEIVCAHCAEPWDRDQRPRFASRLDESSYHVEPNYHGVVTDVTCCICGHGHPVEVRGSHV